MAINSCNWSTLCVCTHLNVKLSPLAGSTTESDFKLPIVWRLLVRLKPRPPSPYRTCPLYPPSRRLVNPKAGLQVLLSLVSNDGPSFVSSWPVAVRLLLCRCTVDNLPALSTVIGIPIDEGSSARRKTVMCVVRMVQERQRKVILGLSVAREGELLSAAHFYNNNNNNNIY